MLWAQRQASGCGEWGSDSASEVESQTHRKGLQGQSHHNWMKTHVRQWARGGDSGDRTVHALPKGIHIHIIENTVLAKQNGGTGRGSLPSVRGLLCGPVQSSGRFSLVDPTRFVQCVWARRGILKVPERADRPATLPSSFLCPSCSFHNTLTHAVFCGPRNLEAWGQNFA